MGSNDLSEKDTLEKASEYVKRIVEPTPAIVRLHCHNCSFDNVKIPNGVEFRFRLLMPFMAAVIRARQNIRDILMLDSRPVVVSVYQARVKEKATERPVVVIYGEINPLRRIWRVLAIYNVVVDEFRDSIVRQFNVITRNEVWHYQQNITLNNKVQVIGVTIANKVLLRYLTRFGEDGASVKLTLLTPDGVQTRRVHVDSEEELWEIEKTIVGQ